LFSFSSVVKTAIKTEEKEIAKFIPRIYQRIRKNGTDYLFPSLNKRLKK